jgi:rhomboid protease GluP
MSECELRATADPALAKEWGLVLAAEGIASRISRRGAEYALRVDAGEVARADALLSAYERENPVERPRVEQPAAVVIAGQGPFNCALAVMTAMLVFFAFTGPRDPHSIWFERGSADAQRIVEGEVWRSVTALSLHADWPHVLANAASGTFFLAILGRTVGPGLALALALMAGTFGNLLNAGLRGSPHFSIGASTAVFGVVGLLSGLGVVRRRERGEGWRRVALPVAGALGLLAMLGTAGDRVDLWAHLFGLVAGLPLGVATALALEHPPGCPAQAGWAALALAAMLGSWRLALA